MSTLLILLLRPIKFASSRLWHISNSYSNNKAKSTITSAGQIIPTPNALSYVHVRAAILTNITGQSIFTNAPIVARQATSWLIALTSSREPRGSPTASPKKTRGPEKILRCKRGEIKSISKPSRIPKSYKTTLKDIQAGRSDILSRINKINNDSDSNSYNSYTIENSISNFRRSLQRWLKCTATKSSHTPTGTSSRVIPKSCTSIVVDHAMRPIIMLRVDRPLTALPATRTQYTHSNLLV